MCRLLGITNFDLAAHRNIVTDFFALAETGIVPPNNEPGHKDGWGIGWYVNGQAKVIKSGNSASGEKALIDKAISEASGSRVFIAHLRKSAWHGTEYTEHAHPFVSNNIMLAHNGTIRDYKDMLGEPGFPGYDTEALLRFALKQNRWGIKKGFAKAVRAIHSKHNYSALNIIFSDGERIFALRDFTKWETYYTLYETRRNGSSIICSEKLKGGSKWNLLKKNVLNEYL